MSTARLRLRTPKPPEPAPDVVWVECGCNDDPRCPRRGQLGILHFPYTSPLARAIVAHRDAARSRRPR